MSELKPCPLCDGKASMRNTWDPDGCYWAHIECDKCGTRSRGHWASSRTEADPQFYEEVRDQWNTRASHDRLSAEVEALRVKAALHDALKQRLNQRMTPARSSWRIVETDPMYGDEKDVYDWEQRIQAMARVDGEKTP